MVIFPSEDLQINLFEFDDTNEKIITAKRIILITIPPIIANIFTIMFLDFFTG